MVSVASFLVTRPQEFVTMQRVRYGLDVKGLCDQVKFGGGVGGAAAVPGECAVANDLRALGDADPACANAAGLCPI